MWFYAAKIVWPADLMFVYPRWTIDAASPIQWIYPVALLACAAAAWMLRSRTRVPLASLLFFCATLFPALGFFDVYPFRYSYVADHFQYLASLGVIVPIAAALAMLVRRVATAPRQTVLAAVPIVATLGVLTWQQAHSYIDSETLYRTTISRNAEAWFPRNNLAALLLQGDPRPEQVDEAAALLRDAINLKPGYAEAHYNLGTALERQGRAKEAEDEYRRVLALDPGQPRALARLAAMGHDRASDMLARGLQLEDSGQLAGGGAARIATVCASIQRVPRSTARSAASCRSRTGVRTRSPHISRSCRSTRHRSRRTTISASSTRKPGTCSEPSSTSRRR